MEEVEAILLAYSADDGSVGAETPDVPGRERDAVDMDAAVLGAGFDVPVIEVVLGGPDGVADRALRPCQHVTHVEEPGLEIDSYGGLEFLMRRTL